MILKKQTQKKISNAIKHAAEKLDALFLHVHEKYQHLLSSQAHSDEQVLIRKNIISIAEQEQRINKSLRKVRFYRDLDEKTSIRLSQIEDEVSTSVEQRQHRQKRILIRI